MIFVVPWVKLVVGLRAVVFCAATVSTLAHQLSRLSSPGHVKVIDDAQVRGSMDVQEPVTDPSTEPQPVLVGDLVTLVLNNGRKHADVSVVETTWFGVKVTGQPPGHGAVITRDVRWGSIEAIFHVTRINGVKQRDARVPPGYERA